ncbi:MAG: hypothetical protein WDA22_13895 [Bacteroidota bacterium]
MNNSSRAEDKTVMVNASIKSEHTDPFFAIARLFFDIGTSSRQEFK